MDFTKKFVKAKSPCADGFRWFLRHYNDGGNYQELLDALVEDGRINDACWLLNQFGPTDAIRVVDAVDAAGMVFAGHLQVRGNVEVDTLVRAGRSLHVQGGLRAGHAQLPGMEHGVYAGDTLRVGGGLNVAGDVVAGGLVRVGWGAVIQGALRCDADVRVQWGVSCTRPIVVRGNLQVGHELDVQADVHCSESLQVGGEATVDGTVRAGHGIVVGRSLHCAMHIEAGWGIKAGHDIHAGNSIQAGEGICAGGRLQTGQGYGVYAGLAVHVDSWDNAARVMAVAPPERLLSGCWSGPAFAQGACA
jgi:cytoskeletal protein CcmA (bactofilin family)